MSSCRNSRSSIWRLLERLIEQMEKGPASSGTQSTSCDTRSVDPKTGGTVDATAAPAPTVEGNARGKSLDSNDPALVATHRDAVVQLALSGYHPTSCCRPQWAKRTDRGAKWKGPMSWREQSSS